MTDLFFGQKQQSKYTTGADYLPDASYDFLGADSYDTATNILTSVGTDLTTVFQVGDLVFNTDWYVPHVFVTDVTTTTVTFDGAIGGINDNGFILTDDVGNPEDCTLVAYRAANVDSAYLVRFTSVNLEPAAFTKKDAAPDYLQLWYSGNGYATSWPLPEYRVVEVVDDNTLKLNQPINCINGEIVFLGQDGARTRTPLKDMRYFTVFYGMGYGYYDMWMEPQTKPADGQWIEPWDAYTVSPYNATIDQIKVRIDDFCNRIEDLCQGNYSDNWVRLLPYPGSGF